MKMEYTTGDFARLCDITKKTLFYYDKIDLLKPTRVDENGYRFYTLYQFDIVSAIKLYQTIGLSLKDIAVIFQNRETADKEEILSNQKQAIRKKILELQQIYEGIEFMSERFAVFKAKGANVLFHEQLTKDEYYQVLPRQELPSDFYNFLHYGYQYGILFEHNNVGETINQATNFFQRVEKKHSNYVKPAGEYLCLFKILKNEDVTSCIPEFMEDIRLADTVGPIYHEDYCSELVGVKDHFIIKLSIQLNV